MYHWCDQSLMHFPPCILNSIFAIIFIYQSNEAAWISDNLDNVTEPHWSCSEWKKLPETLRELGTPIIMVLAFNKLITSWETFVDIMFQFCLLSAPLRLVIDHIDYVVYMIYGLVMACSYALAQCATGYQPHPLCMGTRLLLIQRSLLGLVNIRTVIFSGSSKSVSIPCVSR